MRHFLKIYLQSLSKLSWLFFFKVFDVYGRNEIRNLHQQYLKRPEKGEENVWYQTKQISDIIEDRADVTMVETAACDGNVSLTEVLVINLLVKEYSPDGIFEIGTFDGRTTLNMAMNSREDTKIWTLDLPGDQVESTKFLLHDWEKEYVDKEVSGRRFSERNMTKKISQLYGDSATFDYFPLSRKSGFCIY